VYVCAGEVKQALTGETLELFRAARCARREP
jgi:hypothetical protein